MTEPLATPDDVVGRLGRALTDSELDRVDALLFDASNTVRAYTGQQFDETETTSLIRIRSRTVRLPQQAVSEVAAVEDLNGNALPYSWEDGDAFLTLASTQYVNNFELNIQAGTLIDRVKVTYTHGYATIPDDVVGVVAMVAARSLGVPADESGTQQMSVAGYSETRSAVVASGPFGLLDDEKQVLNGYRQLAGAVPSI